MNETRSMHRRGRTRARLAVVLCLMLAVGLLPTAAFAAPRTDSNVAAEYLNSAIITLSATGANATYCQLDAGDVEATTSVATGVYGAHVLKFWSTDVGGNVEPTVTAPFFVDEDQAPSVACNVQPSYTLTATIDATVTDNFNGSGVDSLYYRIDNGNYVQVVAPASTAATKLFIARLPQVKVASLPPVHITDPLPASHDQNPGDCSVCHEIIQPTPEPTSTPVPTSTPTPGGGLHKTITVTGVGTHTIEYWAQDIARNASAHIVSTFVIAKQTTTLSIKSNHSSVRRNRSVVLSGSLRPGLPVNTHVTVQMRKPGSHTWVTVSTRHTSTSGAWSYSRKLTAKGKYYFRARYAGSAIFAAKISSSVGVTAK
jgi:hypothetical protein